MFTSLLPGCDRESQAPPSCLETPAPAKVPDVPKYHLSKSVKCIQGTSNPHHHRSIQDHHLRELVRKVALRQSQRQDEAELGDDEDALGRLPSVRALWREDPHTNVSPVISPMRGACAHPDSIVTPNGFQKLRTSPTTPRQSTSGLQAYQFLLEHWNPDTKQFSYSTSDSVDFEALDQLRGYVLQVSTEVAAALRQEPVLLRLSVPPSVFILGDIHGNFEDLHYFMSTLLLFHDIEMTPYSFLALGDYVDRGEYSIECVLLCLALKCMSPRTFFMLRGNHEDPGINGDADTYGCCCLKSQCERYFGTAEGGHVWDVLNSAVFPLLPLAAIVDEKIFCSHGGIPRFYGPSEQDDRLALLRLQAFPRFRSLFEPLTRSPAVAHEQAERCWVAAFDLLWGEPSDEAEEINPWGFGRSGHVITFTDAAVECFLRPHGLELLVRAHQERRPCSQSSTQSTPTRCLTVLSSVRGVGMAYIGPNRTVKLVLKESSQDRMDVDEDELAKPSDEVESVAS